MSDQHRHVQQHGQQAMQHGQQAMHHGKEGVKSLLPSNGPSTSKIIATATLLPLGGTLLVLSGLTLASTVVGLAVATPLFILFSPVLVPAAIVIGLAVAGFLSSSAMGMTGMTSLGWILKYVKGATERIPESMEQAKWRVGDVVQYAGQAMQHVKKGVKSLLPSNGPATSKIIATATLLPLGATFIALSGLTLAGTVVGLAVATPLFILFSPVLVPAAIVIGLAVAGFLSSGAMGLTGLGSLGWILRYLKGATERIPETMEQLKRKMGDAVQYAGQAAQYTGQRTKDMGQQLKEIRVTGVEAGKGIENR